MKRTLIPIIILYRKTSKRIEKFLITKISPADAVYPVLNLRILPGSF